ncbi:General odorant-binding protein 72 [Pseudolycoriella hygida]|uniref:General odorant-binding protein 72 n=1 Tax=Pseudolycoriella hygida TaxID=35572 RepID=A0A9Q0RWD7_9DIPT|nr:General odorant-binding protein 72 [Pseudolycoriella hygida]
MELMTMLRNGVPNFDLTVKQMKAMLPEELRESYVNGVNACRNAAEGIEDKCQIAYKLLQCFERNNPQFMFP